MEGDVLLSPARAVRESELIQNFPFYITKLETAVPFGLWTLMLYFAILLSSCQKLQPRFYAVWAVAALLSTAFYGTAFYITTYVTSAEEVAEKYNIMYGQKHKEVTMKKVALTGLLSISAIFLLTMIGMLPSANLVLKTLVAPNWAGWWLGPKIDSHYLTNISLGAVVIIPAIFWYYDLKISGLYSKVEWTKKANEFRMYAMLADGPVFITMLILCTLMYLFFRTSPIIGDAFYAGASAFQFICFNIAFTLIGISKANRREGAKMRRTWIVLAAILLISILIIAFLYERNELSDVFVVGGAFALTGDAADWGRDERRGVDLAFRDWRGSHPNAQIDLVVEDAPATDVTASVTAFRTLADLRGARVIIGPTWDDVAAAFAPLADREQVVVIAPDASSGIEKERDYGYFFSIFTPEHSEMSRLAQYLMAEGLTQLATVYNQDPFSQQWRDTFVEAARRQGLTIVEEFPVADPETQDFRTQIQRLKQLNVQALYVEFTTQDTKVPFCARHRS